MSDFASYLGIASALNLRYKEARTAIDRLGCPVDDTLGRLRRSFPSLNEKLCAFRPLNETTAVDAIRELYTTLAVVLTNSPGPDPTRPLPLSRHSSSLRVSGDVTFACVMYASCWFGDYVPSSIPLVLEIWCAWFPTRQSDADVCFVPANHQYVGTGQHDARYELEGHNARGLVRRHRALNINSFRDIMVLRSGMLVSDCVDHDNRDIVAFLQKAAQLPALIIPSEAIDLWSGQPLAELDRLGLYIRQVKHLTVCTPSPRRMTIIYTFLYSLTSSRQNAHVRGRITPDSKKSVSCCPAPFCSQNAPPRELDRDLPLSHSSAWNPLRLVLQAALQEGLAAEEWQVSIDARVRLCDEWSRGLQPQFGQYNPVAAAVDVAPLCIRIMLRLAQEI
ncbi:hypothetical protein BO85DRAFT_470110 [Aspergillus piperis CBS 112811]|uniref:Uncharacterized protein n=1 Tax=Aspergillus piperis CBS 112811 TaxID=1448313 RepID=A0A8G1VJL9_9EURO|nr:hypothetical protein BO85DRAFT_470110 [Aspergillus piperis CBS 112811]RAH55774.1 hypothetical protein BO85DRAFT_470110 [Aspergillus piperis CBS 112811]